MNEHIHDETSQILAELKNLRNSPLVGRVMFLLSEIKSPTLPPEAIEIIEAFVNHSDYGIRLAAGKLIENYKE